MSSWRNFDRNCIHKILAKNKEEFVREILSQPRSFPRVKSSVTLTECILRLFCDVFYFAVSFF